MTRDDIVMKVVRDADPDRYLAVLYAPEAIRPHLFALYAFDAEIAGIRGRIRQALPGEVRLQWWREVIDSAEDREANGHPVAEALLAAIETHRLPRESFANYLEARMFDLFDDPMPSRADLEGYCGETASAIIQLAAVMLDPVSAAQSAELAGHGGCALAMTGMLASLPVHRSRGQCYIPRDILAAVGTSPEDFIAGRDPDAAKRAVDAMVALASDHLAAFVGGATAMAPSLRPAFLPLAPVPAYLKRIAAKRPVHSDESVAVAGWRRHWLLFRRAGRGW